MQPVLIVGNAVLDLILSVDHHPAADEEMRALSRRRDLGGNGANTARVLAGLGHPVTLLATLAGDAEAAELRRLLEAAGVDCGHLVRAGHGQTPLSCILLDRRDGSRAIVHHRDLPEPGLDDFRALPLERYAWVHFEGRNLPGVAGMMEHLAALGTAAGVSVEIEKDRPGIEALMRHARLVLFSRPWAESRGYRDAAGLLAAMARRAPRAMLTCTWGDRGAWARQGGGTVFHSPARAPAGVVDTLGAGDVFNAGMIHALLAGEPLAEALDAATRLAGIKVGRPGFAGLYNVPLP